MRITESQLRRIIRQEVRTLREAQFDIEAEVDPRLAAQVTGGGDALPWGVQLDVLRDAAAAVRDMYISPTTGKPIFGGPRIDKGFIFMSETYPAESYQGKPTPKQIVADIKSEYEALGGNPDLAYVKVDFPAGGKRATMSVSIQRMVR